jgi:enamine deaminase RidA (YjgF/YER057c/UK114 family)
MRSAVSSLAAIACLAAMSAACAAPAADQSGAHFYPRTDDYPFSSAVQVGDVLYLSGQIGAAEDQKSVVPGGMPAERAG